MSGWQKDVLDFWFVETDPKAWFEKDDAFDRTITERFGMLYEELGAKSAEELSTDTDTALAAILVFDQFARNMFRGSPKAFAQDGKALAVAKKAIAAGFDEQVEPKLRHFFYMPFMHSEAMADQDRCVELFETLNEGDLVTYAVKHREVIEEFGRFPHRNAALGRETTPEEQRWLDDGGGF